MSKRITVKLEKLKTKKQEPCKQQERNNTLSIEREREKERKTHTHTIRIAPNIHQNLQRLEGSEQHFSSAERKEPSTQNQISSESILQKSKRNQGIL